MRVLIACECSGVVREAFRKLGHDAFSCDLLPARDGGPHIQGDAWQTANFGRWDLMIAHPPCDYLTNSAAWAYPDADYEKYPSCGYHQQVKYSTLTGKDRRQAREKAVEFFLSLWRAPIPRICMENPTGHMNTHPDLPQKHPFRQIIHPHQFNEDASKATTLWLKGLPPLIPTGDFPPRLVEWKGKMVKRWSNQTDSGQNKLPPSENRASDRAVTYQGIARAMAQQWSNL